MEMRHLLLTSILSVVHGYHKNMTVYVEAGKACCFWHKVGVSGYIDIEYHVIDARLSDLIISFHISDPSGAIIVADFKKSENAHRHTAVTEGNYRFCFDNSISSYSRKTVSFQLIVEELSFEDSMNATFAKSYKKLIMQISESIERVTAIMHTVRGLQEAYSIREYRSNKVAELMCHKVMNWSMVQISLMIVIGIVQVILVKSPFGNLVK
ncbi:transmembrane emp24 domain-containing protein 5-like [Anticarsia gemmatalis]|uniref:transmembrane emp24 domain-containing protein 5-like n=1 Tax=Anticarsia gemmatalis TaxID=129554 RepID=UPI003F7687A2